MVPVQNSLLDTHFRTLFFLAIFRPAFEFLRRFIRVIESRLRSLPGFSKIRDISPLLGISFQATHNTPPLDSSKAHDDEDLPILSHTIASCCWVILFTSHEPPSHHNNNYWHQQIASLHHHRAPSNHFSFHRPSCCHQHPPWGRLPRPISTPILFALVAVLHAIRISLNNNKEETNNHNNHES